MAAAAISNGVSCNGIPFVRFGAGPKTMLFMAGGPGNTVPKGLGAAGFVRGMKAMTDEYTIVLVTRKSGLPSGYTTRDMSDDCAEMVREELGGHVDLVMGVSFGGMIALHFAADHADLFDRMVIAMSGHVVSDEAIGIDTRYADLISRGRDRDAMSLRADAAFTGAARVLMKVVLWLFGKTLLGPVDDTFRRDVVVEARAEAQPIGADVLRRIHVPVLIVGSDADFAFPLQSTTELAAAIEGAELTVYPGGHTAAFLDKRFAGDVRDFTSRGTRA